MKQRKVSSIYCSVAVVCLINILSKGIGFIREMLMASCFGDSEVTDTFIMSNSIVNILFGVLMTIAVLYISFLTENNEKNEDNQTSQFIQAILLIFLMVETFLLSFQNLVIRFIAPGFSDGNMQLLRRFLPYSSIGFLLSVINQIFISRLNYDRVFFRANITTIALGGMQILGVTAAHKSANILYLGIFQVGGCLLQMLILIWVLTLAGVKIKFSLVQAGFLKKIIHLSTPVILSTIVDDVNVTVDKIFGSYLDAGVISAMNYAHLVKQLIFYVIVSSGVSVIYPEISKLVNQKKKTQIEKMLSYYLWVTGVILIPITIGSFLCSQYIIKIIYERGRFDTQATIVTGQVFAMYVLSVFPLAIRELIQRVLYSYQDTKTTFQVNVAMSFSNIFMNIILFTKLKQIGLAFSTALSAYIVLPLYMRALRKNAIKVNLKYLLKEFLIISVLSSACTFPLSYCMRHTEVSGVRMAGVIMLTAMLYVFCILVFRGKKIWEINKWL